MYGQLISSVTVGSGGAASIDFTSIPQTFTDLVLVYSSRLESWAGQVGDNTAIRFNGDSGNNYAWKTFWGNGSSVINSGTSSINYARIGFQSGDGSTSNTFGNAIVTIPNYAGSTYKSYSGDIVSENNGTEAYQSLVAGLWSNTSAITSIVLTSTTNTDFNQYTVASLYGLTKGSGGATVS